MYEVELRVAAEEGTWAHADSTHFSTTVSLIHIRERQRHLEVRQRDDLVTLLSENESLFTDVHRRHSNVVHEVKVRSERPIKQSAYPGRPEKRELMRKDV